MKIAQVAETGKLLTWSIGLMLFMWVGKGVDWIELKCLKTFRPAKHKKIMETRAWVGEDMW